MDWCKNNVFWSVLHVYYFILFYFISFAKKKQTNKQTEECWQGHCNSCGQLSQWARILIKKIIKKRNIKKHSDTRKTTATYNKLLNETRDEHYYILYR